MFSQTLAVCVLLASQLHKNSFCKACHAQAVKEGERKAAADTANAESYKPNPKDFYHLSVEMASQIAANLTGIDESAKAVELLLTGSETAAIEWAETILNAPEPEPDYPDISIILTNLSRRH